MKNTFFHSFTRESLSAFSVMAVNWVMEMQSGRTHPQGGWSTGGGAIAIIQGVIYSDGANAGYYCGR